VIREHFKRAEESRATFYSGVIAIFVVNYGREFGEICKSDLWSQNRRKLFNCFGPI